MSTLGQSPYLEQIDKLIADRQQKLQEVALRTDFTQAEKIQLENAINSHYNRLIEETMELQRGGEILRRGLLEEIEEAYPGLEMWHY